MAVMGAVMGSTRRGGLAIAAAALLGGCFVFDASLYLDAGGGPLAGELSDTCSGAPLLTLDDAMRTHTFSVDTRGRTDAERDVVGCTGAQQSGPDLFLAIAPSAGSERWHFHVRVDPAQGGADPSIYVLRNCDVRTCDDGDGLDVCGTGSDEHFTFVPTPGVRHVVAFDSASAEGFAGTVEAYRTVCGDGAQDHGENCDDGNDVDDDDCDDACRRVLRGASPTEREVNDDIYAANRLVLEAGETMAVRGDISRLCEVDVFAIHVPANGSIAAALRAEGGGPCPAAGEGVRLELLELIEGRPRVRVAGVVQDGEICPAIASDAPLARNLPAGTYYLRVSKVQERPDEMRYQLEVSLGG